MADPPTGYCRPDDWFGDGARRLATGLGQARRHAAVEHLARAFTRYQDAHAGRLAAAVTYYAFFAAFSLGLLGFAILGYVLDDPKVLESVQTYLAQNLPRLDAQALRDARGTAGLIAFVVLTVAGVLWVDALRSSIRSIWQLNEYPGRFFLRPLIDLVVLAGLGLLLAASLAVAFGAEALLHWLLPHLAGAVAAHGRHVPARHRSQHRAVGGRADRAAPATDAAAPRAAPGVADHRRA